MRTSVKGLCSAVPLLLVAGIGLTACDPPLQLTVNVTADGHDALPGDGICEVTPGAGDCSLRAAVEEGNLATTIVHVAVPAGTFVLGTGGPLVMTGPSPSVTLQADASAVVDAAGHNNVIEVHGHTSVIGLTLHGAAHDGIHVFTGGRLDLAASTATTNGSYGVEGDAGSSVTVALSTLSGNHLGGLSSAGSVTLASSVVTGNGTGDTSGSTFGAAVTVTNGATIVDSTISHNAAAGLSSLGGTTSVSRSTIDHNESSWVCVYVGCASFGNGPGGIYAESGSLTLVNSTVTGNTVVNPFDATVTEAAMQVGISTCGGTGCIQHSASASIVSSTVDEQAYVVFGVITASASAMSSCLSSGLGNGSLAFFADGGSNVVTDASGCTFSSVLHVPDLMIAPLADNGGRTQTHLPAAGSPLVDHIAAGTAGRCDGTITTDQRGVARPQGPACDVGSVEGHG